jgi:response regulator RpfG family c-di-GMP phosphodiesterase
MTINDNDLLFAGNDEENLLTEAPLALIAEPQWKVLIVDDDEEVHNVTKMVLRRFTFDGKAVMFLSAYSSLEGKKILTENPDIAVILLDVVMEEDDSGLQMARYIRTDLSNHLVRIILRTGQPGQAPEHKVVVEYDINDYKEKTELTTQKLHTTLVTALRSYRDMNIIEINRRSLKKIIESSASMFELQSMSNFATGVLSQLVALLNVNPSALYCNASGLAATKKGHNDFQVLAATGNYEPLIGTVIQPGMILIAMGDIMTAFKEKKSLYFPDRFIIYFCSKHGSENVIYLDGIAALSIWDRDLVEIFCTNVSVAFDNIYLNQEVEDTQKEILFTLGEVAEARSQETGHHVKRVAEMAKLLALRYGLSPEEAESLRLAAPIHDVGKLAIPDAILNKPGKLTTDEFTIMKTHSPIGYEMLKNSKRSILKLGAIIALQHHERYDGTGYPQGLVGEDIHIFGRIVALADVFDALNSVRVYKKTWPMEEILEYLVAERGKHFDARLVDIFIENLDDILLICKRLADV